jgi:hypothetical protein
MATHAAGSRGGHNHWTLEGTCPDTGRRHYEKLYQDDVVISPTFYQPEQSASEAERKLGTEMMKFNGICKQKAGFDRLMRAFADASGGPRGNLDQLEAALKSIQMQGVGRETIHYIALSCQILFGPECRVSFTLSQCAVIAEKFFQNRLLLPAVTLADTSNSSGVNTKVPFLQATHQTSAHSKSRGDQPPLYTSRTHGDILSWKRDGTERSHFDGFIAQTPPVPQ